MADTKIVGPHSGPKEALLKYAVAIASKRMTAVQEFVDELYAQNVMDGFMIAIQSIHETDGWKSPIWESRLNPAGLGVTDGADQGISYKNGKDAARAILVHHAAYVGITLPSAWIAWKPLDPRYDAVKQAGFFGKVKTWADYGGGLWATDPSYFEGITAREKAVRKYEGGYMPNVIDKWLHVTQDGYIGVNRRYIGRFGMEPKIIVLHIQEGNNWGSWQHFHTVSASATVFVGKNGDIWRLVPESDAPWTNGDVKSPSVLGKSIINKYGADPNVYSLTIETEGYTAEWPKGNVQIESVVWQIKTWMAKYGIPIENVIKHAEINHVDREYCPGDAFYNEVIRRLKASVVTTPTVKPLAIKVTDPTTKKVWDGKANITVDGVVYHGAIQKVKIATDGVPCRRLPTITAAELRSRLAKDTEVSVIGWSEGEAVKGENRWWITKNFSRIHVSGTNEKPSTKPQVPTPEKLPGGAKIVGGVVYYPTKENGNAWRDLEVTAKKANLREKANLTSKVVGVVNRGDKLKAAYWCFGDEVNEENIWWVLVPTDGSDPIANGGRLWVSATYEDRPI